MKQLLLVLLMSVLGMAVLAQTKKKSEPKVQVLAPVPLVYVASWGPMKGGDALQVQVVSTLPAPLIVKDQNGTIYQVNSFRINYSFISTYKDEETQQTKSVKDFRVMDINNSNKLTNDWIESFKDNIKAGDQILLNKILFRNGAGKLQYATDVKIRVI